ncbi:uncharacterized protein [Euphorbia lathyris]
MRWECEPNTRWIAAEYKRPTESEIPQKVPKFVRFQFSQVDLEASKLQPLKERKKMRKEDTVKLISAEGFEFVIDKEAAMVSQTIRNMLTSPGSFAETQHGEVTFPEISTTILEKICQYFYWSLQYAKGKETEFPIEPELTLELMMAANYLHT